MIKIIGLLVFFVSYSILAASNPCKIDPARCDIDDTPRSPECSASDLDCGSIPGIQCAVPFTTKNKSVKCEVDSKTMLIKCIVTGFDNIPPVNFQEIPSLHDLSLVFSYPCYLRADCAKKFKCTGCDPSSDLDCPTTSSDISGGE